MIAGMVMQTRWETLGWSLPPKLWATLRCAGKMKTATSTSTHQNIDYCHKQTYCSYNVTVCCVECLLPQSGSTFIFPFSQATCTAVTTHLNSITSACAYQSTFSVQCIICMSCMCVYVCTRDFSSSVLLLGAHCRQVLSNDAESDRVWRQGRGHNGCPGQWQQ